MKDTLDAAWMDFAKVVSLSAGLFGCTVLLKQCHRLL